ncbi:3255_t:CDS:2 [Diversispora eburnea]|uniref:3255_t:CDS:1 n=1 Tax=Diversispora eburnea TaxID=1213867 RepID=A0A9N8YIL5_9GLOM|nr:3255_t:CDS:2 [Diversispora eburnea]
MCCGSKTSKWSKIFVLVSIVQAIITVILETLILVRNENLRQDLLHKSARTTNSTSIPSSSNSSSSSYIYHFPEMANARCNASLVNSLDDRIERIESENVIFIFFQLFQIWLNLDAIQLAEILIWRGRLENACELSSLNLHFVSSDVPFIIAYMLFATLMGFLCYHLYREFGWNIYRTIGGDIIMQNVQNVSDICTISKD